MGNYGLISGAFSSTSGKADITLTQNGDILYYNSGRQRLPKEDNDDILTLKLGLPSWEPPAGNGAAISYVASGVAAGTVTEISVDFTAISQTDISALMVVWSAGLTTQTNMKIQVNGNTGANYDSDGAAQYGGSSALVNWSGQTGYEHSRSELGTKRLTVVYLYPNTNFDEVVFISQSASNLGSQTMSGFLNGITETDFDNVTLAQRDPSPTALIAINSRIDVYKISNS